MSAQTAPEDRTQEELLHDVRYGSSEERESALSRLAAVGEAEALDAVIDFLQKTPQDESAEAGLDALRVLAHKYMPLERYGLTEALIPFLDDKDWQKRLTSVRLLNAYPNELAIEPIRMLVYEAREKIYREQHIASTTTRILTERTLSEAIMALANGGRLLVLPDILEMMEEPALRVIATRSLGLIGSDTERARLEDLIEDRDPRVRDAAQWALALMDERAEQFLNPPSEIPAPPPGRLNPLYWAHRQLEASDDSLLQFLIVRIAVEHLILDRFVSDGNVPEWCTITTRRYLGDAPPNHRENDAEIIGVWDYSFHGPRLRRRSRINSGAQTVRPKASSGRGAIITISYPERLPVAGWGLVSYDCQFQPFHGQGMIFKVYEQDEGWTFIQRQDTWAT
ncbi:MAG: HEAT repeat domain-containing protein [Anaerolineae bacterium]|nr:HEAT repeat domain-containing protein [Anaerolineae bacterium]